MKPTHDNIVALLKSHPGCALHSISGVCLRLSANKYPYYGLLCNGIYFRKIEKIEKDNDFIKLSFLEKFNNVELVDDMLIFDNILAINFGERPQ